MYFNEVYVNPEESLQLGVVQMDDGQGRCLVCPKSFCNIYKAKRHYTDVHCKDGILMTCKLCNSKFSTQRYVDEHMKSNHGISKKMLANMIVPK